MYKHIKLLDEGAFAVKEEPREVSTIAIVTYNQSLLFIFFSLLSSVILLGLLRC